MLSGLLRETLNYLKARGPGLQSFEMVTWDEPTINRKSPMYTGWVVPMKDCSEPSELTEFTPGPGQICCEINPL